jgi:hypothetical protein
MVESLVSQLLEFKDDLLDKGPALSLSWLFSYEEFCTTHRTQVALQYTPGEHIDPTHYCNEITYDDSKGSHLNLSD